MIPCPPAPAGFFFREEGAAREPCRRSKRGCAFCRISPFGAEGEKTRIFGRNAQFSPLQSGGGCAILPVRRAGGSLCRARRFFGEAYRNEEKTSHPTDDGALPGLSVRLYGVRQRRGDRGKRQLVRGRERHGRFGGGGGRFPRRDRPERALVHRRRGHGRLGGAFGRARLDRAERQLVRRRRGHGHRGGGGGRLGRHRRAGRALVYRRRGYRFCRRERPRPAGAGILPARGRHLRRRRRQRALFCAPSRSPPASTAGR